MSGHEAGEHEEDEQQHALDDGECNIDSDLWVMTLV
jgi:hypothetical protein